MLIYILTVKHCVIVAVAWLTASHLLVWKQSSLYAKCSMWEQCDITMEHSLKVTEAIITGCLQPEETPPGMTTSRHRAWLETRAKRKCSRARFCPDAPNITSPTAVLLINRRYVAVLVDLNPPWPLNPGVNSLKTYHIYINILYIYNDGINLNFICTTTERHLHTHITGWSGQLHETALVVSDTGGVVKPISLSPVASICSSQVTYCTRLQHLSQQGLHHHGFYWLSSSLRHRCSS